MNSAPVMLYDGDCAFCARWIRKWQGMTGESVRYFPYQEVLSDYPQVSEAACQKAVQLILPDGQVLSGARAVFKALALSGKYRWLWWSYKKIPLFAPLSEWFYGLIAHHRIFFSRFF